MSPPVFLSIDWDFFFFRALEAPEGYDLLVKNDQGQEYNLDSFFDWGTNEGNSPILQTLMWRQRWAAFKAHGLDPLYYTKSFPEEHRISPESFIDRLEERFALKNQMVMLSDSHRHAFYTGIDAYHANDEQPIDIIHFDAHHDLGYGGTIKPGDRLRDYHCGNWLYALVGQPNIVKSLTVVYPDWRGLYEAEAQDLSHLEEFQHIQFITYKDWLAQPYEPRLVDYSHICRSGTWVPPWFDQEFLAFAYGFSASEFTCFDCDHKPEWADACTARAWSEPLEEIEQAKHMMKLLKEYNERAKFP